MNPATDTLHTDTVRPTAGKWSCDSVALASDLLPPLDVLSVLLAGYLSNWLYAVGVSPTGLALGAWSSYEWTALVAAAVLAAVCLYDNQFGTRASRGQRAVLVRRYGFGFLTFAGATLVVAFASHALDSLPSAWVMLWFGTSLLLTSLARMLLARSIGRLEREGVLTEVIAVVGAGPLADRLIRHLRRTRGDRTEILGVFDDATAVTVADLIALGTTRSIDWIVLALPCTVEDPLESLVHRLKALAAPIVLCPQNFGFTHPSQTIDYLGDGVPLTLLADRPILRWSAVVKELSILLPYRTFLPRRPPSDHARRIVGEMQDSGRIVVASKDYARSGSEIVATRFGRRHDDVVVTPNADVASCETRGTVGPAMLAEAAQS